MLHTRSRSLRAAFAVAAAAALALTGCSSGGETPAETTAAAGDGEWPVVFQNADDTTTEIPAKPESILSTSVSVTGTLLAIDAPVTATAGAANGKFFPQWSSVAEERGVQVTWPAGSVDLEAAHAAAPDLIIVSASGADSAVDQLADFQAIAPTIVVDYANQSWQDLAVQLGDALGLGAQAQAKVDEFDAYVADAAGKITVPEGTANIISFNGPGEDNPIARVGGPHADLLESLGFTIEDPDVSWHTQAQPRNDFVWAPYEKLTELTSQTTFILSQDNEGAKAFAEDPALANLPSVVDGQVYGLGKNSFRVDFYSATEIVDSVVANFAK